MKNKIQRLILIRHGYSMGNHDVKNYQKHGDANVSLHDKGWEQAIRAGTFLSKYLKENPETSKGQKRIWVSPFKRTKETTSGIIHGASDDLNDYDVRENAYLIEQSFGVFSHFPDAGILEKMLPLQKEFHDKSTPQQRFLTPKPMGESPFDVYQRIDSFLETIHRDAKHGVQDLICVSHGTTIRTLIMRFLNTSINSFEGFYSPNNCDIIVLERGKDGKMGAIKIFDGETGKAANIDIGKQLFERCPRLSRKTLPSVPKHLRNKKQFP